MPHARSSFAVSCVLVFWVTFGPQNTCDAKPLRKNRPKLSQEITIGGDKFSPSSKPLTRGAPLKFSIEGRQAGIVETTQQSASLLKRMQDLHAAVEAAKAVKPENGDNRSHTIIKGLITTRAGAPEVLRRDLERLLIATLNSADEAFEDASGKIKSMNVRVWSYRRLDNSGENWGPIVEAAPNDVLLIPVLNLLIKDELREATISQLQVPDFVPSGNGPDGRTNAPQDFDVINLHTHGLNVSPDWPADDIFRQIHPLQLKFFVYKIPPEHPNGTFFYHPHHHGSVATQVAGGMAGALIIRDPGKGLDRYGIEKGWPAATESTLLVQQLTLYRLKDQNTLFSRPEFFAMKDTGPWTDVDGEHKEWVEKCFGIRSPLAVLAKILDHKDAAIKLQNQPDATLPDPDNPANNPYVQTWVSGRLVPSLDIAEKPMAFGETRRFRLIHAGIEDNVDLTIAGGATAPKPQVQVIAWDGLPLLKPYFIAANPDGGPTGLLEAEERNHPLVISPGNRADVLVRIPPPKARPTEAVTYSVQSGDVLLAKFTVDPSRPDILNDGFLSDAEAALMWSKDSSYYCLPKIEAEPFGGQSFSIQFADAQVDAQGKFTGGTFKLNHKSFPEDEIDFRMGEPRRLTLATTEGGSAHPLHIHVNPFLVSAALDDVGIKARKLNGLPVGQFWADTLLLQPPTDVVSVTEAVMPFNNWTGRFVSHCHILDHEDAGMMDIVRILPAIGGFPSKIPTDSVFDVVAIPKEVFKNARQEWPTKNAPIPGSVNDTVTMLVFMPRVDGKTCPHCTLAVQAVCKVRRQLPGDVRLRIVVINASDADDLPSASALGLDPKLDILCSDSELKSFEAIGLIDDVPFLTDDGRTFSTSFVKGEDHLRKPVHATDVMHGVFIVTADGFVSSIRRGFMAFDEAEQLIEEVKLAAVSYAPSKAAPPTASKATKLLFERQTTRRKNFDKQAN